MAEQIRELIKTEDREEMKTKFAELKGTGTYEKWVKDFLKEKGYTIKEVKVDYNTKEEKMSFPVDDFDSQLHFPSNLPVSSFVLTGITGSLFDSTSSFEHDITNAMLRANRIIPNRFIRICFIFDNLLVYNYNNKNT